MKHGSNLRTSHHRAPLPVCKARTAVEDPDLADAINEACDKCLRAMLGGHQAAARQLADELSDQQAYLLTEREEEAARFLGVLVGLLNHRVPQAAAELTGTYGQAINRLFNQLQGCDWRLVEEGKEGALPGSEQPRFSTWEEVLGGKKPGGQQQERQWQQQQQGSSSSSSRGAPAVGRQGAPMDPSYYHLLGVAPSASAADIKTAYRQQALKLHPDVNDAPDATQHFAALAHAYDTLSNDTSRRLYDRYGPDGMKQHAGKHRIASLLFCASGGSGNAGRAWDEFKPFKKENKRTRAKDAARASYSASSLDEEDAPDADPQRSSTTAAPARQQPSESEPALLPVTGDIVEYPLGDVVKAELMDGRRAGVGLLVARNMDRGDVKRLPPESLDLCEVEPLRQEEPDSDRWIPDELSPPSFCRLGDLRQVAVASYDPRFDVWVITAPLSEGCGGPELPEEVMV
ncbi:hypothetical protein N2152v2_003932 [Parachlorella kessleri]